MSTAATLGTDAAQRKIFNLVIAEAFANTPQRLFEAEREAKTRWAVARRVERVARIAQARRAAEKRREARWAAEKKEQETLEASKERLARRLARSAAAVAERRRVKAAARAERAKRARFKLSDLGKQLQKLCDKQTAAAYHEASVKVRDAYDLLQNWPNMTWGKQRALAKKLSAPKTKITRFDHAAALFQILRGR